MHIIEGFLHNRDPKPVSLIKYNGKDYATVAIAPANNGIVDTKKELGGKDVDGLIVTCFNLQTNTLDIREIHSDDQGNLLVTPLVVNPNDLNYSPSSSGKTIPVSSDSPQLHFNTPGGFLGPDLLVLSAMKFSEIKTAEGTNIPTETNSPVVESQAQIPPSSQLSPRRGVESEVSSETSTALVPLDQSIVPSGQVSVDEAFDKMEERGAEVTAATFQAVMDLSGIPAAGKELVQPVIETVMNTAVQAGTPVLNENAKIIFKALTIAAATALGVSPHVLLGIAITVGLSVGINYAVDRSSKALAAEGTKLAGEIRKYVKEWKERHPIQEKTISKEAQFKSIVKALQNTDLSIQEFAAKQLLQFLENEGNERFHQRIFNLAVEHFRDRIITDSNNQQPDVVDLAFLQVFLQAAAKIRDVFLQNGELRHDNQIKFLNASGVHFDGLNLKKCEFNDLILSGATFRYANLEGADLERTILVGANLEMTILENANLQGADLEGADLQNANLEGTNLQGTDLWNLGKWRGVATNLEGANIYGVKGLTLEERNKLLNSGAVEIQPKDYFK